MMKHGKPNDVVQNRPIVIDESISFTIDRMPQKDRSNAMALYWFYSRHACRQKTQSIFCRNRFVQGTNSDGTRNGKGLGWSTSKITRIRKLLEHYGLIRIKQGFDENGKFEKQYVEIVYYKGRESVEKAQYEQMLAEREHKINEQAGQIAKLESLLSRFHGSTKNTYPSKTTLNAYRDSPILNACKPSDIVAASKAGQRPRPKTLNLHGRDKAKSSEILLAIKLFKILLPILRGTPNKLPKKDPQTGHRDFSQWAREFHKLLKTLDYSDINKALDWYAKHLKDRYTPQCFSARTFCEKYVQVLGAMKRERQDAMKNDPIASIPPVDQWGNPMDDGK